jgi:7-keto-8-aminopelargonate synthetase-like enzyme
LYKSESIITTPQSAAIKTRDGREMLNFYANSYLELADNGAAQAGRKRLARGHARTYEGAPVCTQKVTLVAWMMFAFAVASAAATDGCARIPSWHRAES